jgi:hypothetical protein
MIPTFLTGLAAGSGWLLGLAFYKFLDGLFILVNYRRFVTARPLCNSHVILLQ